MKVSTTKDRIGSAEYPDHRRLAAADTREGDKERESLKTHWLTSEQAGLRLGLGRNTLAEWRCDRRTNQPPFAKFGGKALRYSVAALDAWAQAQVVDPKTHSTI